MPIYEYQCDRCGHRFESLVKMGEEAKPPCPSCRSKKVSRLISKGGFVLKGTGWYKTDYPSEARRKGLAADKGEGHSTEKKAGAAGPKAEGATETKAETKRESKSETKHEAKTEPKSGKKKASKD
jgi:putative FmdB family regulatory protein